MASLCGKPGENVLVVPKSRYGPTIRLTPAVSVALGRWSSSKANERRRLHR
jgi:hypothetical protein